jgi:hypothetical protein
MYVYRGLETNRSIRLLQLLPATDSRSALRGLLDHIELDRVAPRPYEALSYVWGSSGSSDEIFIQERRLRTGVNLGRALRRLRRTREPRNLWIDAICINQEDIKEKDRQVQLMADIYMQASQVVVFLDGLDEFRDRSSGIGEPSSIESKSGNTSSRHPAINRRSIDIVDGLLPDRFYERMLEAAWFSRTWVVQEAVFAKSLVFLVGGREINGSGLVEGLSVYYASKEIKRKGQERLLPRALALNWSWASSQAPTYSRIPTYLPNRSGIRDTLAVAEYLRKRLRNVSLLELLERFRGYKTTDPRDKVYALLGLSSDSKIIGVSPDYSKSQEDVFAGVAAAIIAHSKTVQVLSYAEKIPFDTSQTLKNHMLPSWVPDWTQRLQTAPLWSPWFDASRASEVQLRASTGSSKLHLAATVACSVLRVYDSPWLAKGYPPSGVQHEGNEAMMNHGIDMLLELTDWTLSFDHQALDPKRNEESWDNALCCWACAGVELTADGKWAKYEPWTAGSIDAMYEIDSYYISVALRVGQRRAFYTDRGDLGFGPPSLAPGDLIAVIPGGRVPLALRHASKRSDEYILIGECYVQGLMHGEVMSSDVRVTNVVLV